MPADVLREILRVKAKQERGEEIDNVITPSNHQHNVIYGDGF